MPGPLSIAAVYFLGTAATILLAVRSRDTRGPVANELTGLAISVAVWSLFYGFESLSRTAEFRIFWSQFAYIGTYASAAFLLRFCIRWLHPRYAGWWLTTLWVVPAIIVIGAFTNELHGLVWPYVRPSSRLPFVYFYGHGPLFWVGAVYQYLLVGSSVVLVAVAVRTRVGIYRRQAVLVLIGLGVALSANIVYVSGALGELSLDITPLGLAAAAGFFLTGIARARLLELLPAARHRVVDEMPDGLMVLDQAMRVVDWNRAALELWELDQVGVMGRPASALIPGWTEAVPERLPDALRVAIGRTDEHGVEHHIETDLRRLAVHGVRADGWIVLFHDSTELRAAERRLQEANASLAALNRELTRQAVHDGLTGLFNRSYLDEALPRELARAEREQKPVGLLILDVDYFKDVNDTHGHDTGDAVIVGVASIVKNQVRAGDLPCRYGGDELVAVMPGATRAEALRIGERIREAVERADLERAIRVTVSVGVAVYPGDADGPANLFREADRALYVAKDRGRNCVVGAGHA